MAEQFSALPEGRYKVTIEKVGQYEHPGRYRYYFAIVMAEILHKCADRFQIINPRTGETSPPRTTADIHEIMKALYNPVMVVTHKGITNSGGTTTNLSDRDFIGEYMESIMAEFASPPFLCDFKDIDDWRQEMKMKREQRQT